MAFRYEKYSDTLTITEWSTPTWNGFISGDLPAQGFTPQIDHTITLVRLYLKKFNDGSYPEQILALNIYIADGSGFPTGSSLVNSSIDSSIISQDSWGWIDFSLGNGVPLIAGNTYVIYLSTTTDKVDQDEVYWAYRGSNVYSGGIASHFVWNPPGGIGSAEWQEIAADHFFEEWGIGTRPPPDPMPSFPDARPASYDPDLIWVPGEWTDPDTYVPPEWGEPSRYFATGGGQWGQQLVVVGNGKVYYSELN